jgi:hypothetical protein
MSYSDDDLNDLLGAYALDAVDDNERQAIDDYLMRSTTARDEVRRHHEVAMALATTPGQAPQALWDRISSSMMKSAVDETASSNTATSDTATSDTATSNTTVGNTTVGNRAVGNTTTEASSMAPYQSANAEATFPFPLSSKTNHVQTSPSSRSSIRRTTRRARRNEASRIRPSSGDQRRVMSIAAAALIALGLGAVAVRQNNTIRNLRSDVAIANASAIQSQQAANASKREVKLAREDVARSKNATREAQRELHESSKLEFVVKNLLARAGTSTASLNAPNGGVELVQVVVSPTGQGYLIAKALPPLPSGHTYQLWGVKNKAILSLGVFGTKPSTLEFAAHEQWNQFVLTEEQSPGVASSKQPALAVGNVRTI